MKFYFLIAILLNFSVSFTQKLNPPILISDDGKFILNVEERSNYGLSYKFLTVLQFDSLEFKSICILKDDSVFTLIPSYSGQYGYFFYINDKKTYHIIYDTLLQEEFNTKFGFNDTKWVYPEPVQLVVDTLRIMLDEPRNNNNYFIYSYDTVDMSKSYELLAKLIYKGNILYSVVESGGDRYIFNSLKLRNSALYLDEARNRYLLTAYLEIKKYINDEITYETKTLVLGHEIAEDGLITW